MNVFAKFDEIPLMLLQDIKETKVTDTLSFIRTDGRENSIPSHKHSLGGGGYNKRPEDQWSCKCSPDILA